MAGITYKDAGVDLEAAERSLSAVKRLVAETHGPRVLKDVGLFAAFFDGRFPELKHPVLTASVDGVGTKLKIAFATGKHNTVGQDLVNHCVNDIMTSGSRPLFFLDYFATGRLEPDVLEAVVSGIAKACKENECALIGGETAEMPDMYPPGEYDLAGMIVGVVDKDAIVDGSGIQAGDVLIGLPSSGLHTNGYSLARKVLLEIGGFSVDCYVPGLEWTIGEELLKVHRSYKRAIEAALATGAVLGISHVTGGGIVGNTRRLLPKGLDLKISWGSWPEPAIFGVIRRLGRVPEEEMRRTFNLGIGLVFVVHQEDVRKVRLALAEAGEMTFVIGEVVKAG